MVGIPVMDHLPAVADATDPAAMQQLVTSWQRSLRARNLAPKTIEIYVAQGLARGELSQNH